MKFSFLFVIISLSFIQYIEVVQSTCNDTNITSASFFLNSSSLLDHLDFNAICSVDTITITLNRCAATAMGYGSTVALYDIDGESFLNDMCMNDDDGDYITIQLRGNFSECAYETTKTEEGTSYAFQLKTVSNYTNYFISRRPQLRFNFTCNYDVSLKMSSKNLLVVKSNNKNFNLNLKSENSIPDEIFSSSFIFFKDSSFQHPYPENQTIIFRVPDFVYFEISIDAGDNYVTQGHDCWATPHSNSNDPHKYYFVKNGCATVDKFYPGANVVIQNYNSSKLQVGFRAFTWTKNKAGLYLHCRIGLCNTDIFSNCYDSPCTNKRRFRRHVIRHSVDRHMLSSERLTVIPHPTSDCTSALGSFLCR